MHKYRRINLFQFVRLNFLYPNVHRAKRAFIFTYRPGKIHISRNAIIYLNNDLFLNVYEEQSILRKGCIVMSGENAILRVNGPTRFMAGYFAQIYGELTVSGGQFNEGTRIYCSNSIKFGEGSGASYNTVIRDNTAHFSGTSLNNLTYTTAPIVIGDHVWIGENAAIYQGSDIGDGAIIGNRAKVFGAIPPRAMVAPEIDKVALTDVYWIFDAEKREEEIARFYKNEKDASHAQGKDNEIYPVAEAIIKCVEEILKEFINCDNISKENDLIGRKVISSLAIISFTEALEERFGITIPFQEINAENYYNVRAIAGLVERLQTSGKSIKEGFNCYNKKNESKIENQNIRQKLDLNNGITEKTVVQCIFENSYKAPHKAAIITEHERTDYNELCKMIYSYSEVMKNHGVKDSDCVVMQAKCSEEYIAAFYACHLLSAVPVPLEKEIGKERILEISNEVNAACIVSDIEIDRDESITYKQLVAEADVDIDVPLFSLTFPEMDQPAQILFTTGTTGKSKGVVSSHRALSYNSYCVAKEIQLKQDEVQMILFPLNHSVGNKQVNMMLANGETCVINNSLNDINIVVEMIRQWNVTSMVIPPAGIKIVLKKAGKELYNENIKIDYAVAASAPIDRECIDLFYKTFPESVLYNDYGSTETMDICFFSCKKDQEALLGKPVESVQVRLKTENGNYTQEANIVGRVCVKSPMMMTGYYKQQKLTDESFCDGWQMMGDLGFFDEAGNLHFAGRADDVINIGGYKISPIETEEIASESGLISDSVLIQSTDRFGTSYLELLVVPREVEQFSKDELKHFLSSRLESYRVPQKITVVDEIKKTYNGKLDRKSYRKTPDKTSL